MIYLKLFYNFLLVGLFSIGGGYTTVSLVTDLAKKFDTIDSDMVSNFIAIAESTPGSIAVNLATYVGSSEAGILGAIIATIALILPAFVIIIVFAVYFTDKLKNPKFTYALSIIRACVTGIIIAVGIGMLYKNTIDNEIDPVAIIIAILLLAIMYIYKKMKKKPASSILIIICGAILGIAINLLL